MRRDILLIIQLVLFTGFAATQYIGINCSTNLDCPPWLACVDGECKMCKKPGTLCHENDINWSCCKGTVCQAVNPGLNFCMPEKCILNTECPPGFDCVLRLGKCGICKKDGELCSLPYDKEECCSSYCDVKSYNGTGTCKNLFNFP